MTNVKKGVSYFYLGLVFLFLYAPILVLIVLSFNNANGNIMNTVYVIRFKIDKIIQD